MKFELLTILTDYANLKKGGMKLKKNSSPLKLLSQSQPNSAEMILGLKKYLFLVMAAILDTRWC
jgi:hypothetical protein